MYQNKDIQSRWSFSNPNVGHVAIENANEALTQMES